MEVKGSWIYFTVTALAGILAAFVHFVIFIIVFFFLLLFLFKIKAFSKKYLFLISLIFFLFLIRSELAEKANKSKFTADETNFYILFQKDLKIDGDRLSAVGKELLRKEKFVISYQIKTEEEKKWIIENLKTGIACKVIGTLSEPNTATNVNAFNYKEYLIRHQIFWILKADQVNMSQCTSQKKTPFSFFQSVRENGIQYVQDHFPSESAPLAIALLFGERDYIDTSVLETYEKLGIVHLLAISGLHVGMLAGMIYYLGIRIGITRERMTIGLLLFLPCYAIITGAAPSVIRAVSMMVLFLSLKKWSFHAINTIDIICIVFLIYTFLTPYVIYDVGFQLSFSVSFALILSAPILLKRFHQAFPLLLATSFICQLAAIPIMLYYFYEVSLISILANTIFIPLFSFIILPAIFLLFLLHLLLGTTIGFLIPPLNTLIIAMNGLALQLSLVPFAMLTFGRPSVFVMFLYLWSIPSFFSLWERIKGVKRFVQVLLLPLSIMCVQLLGNSLSPYGEITFIDVGQGDSIFIKLPFGRGNYLIDAGGTIQFNTEEWKERKKEYEVGKDVVVPFLKSKGIRTIDKLILTHGDADHIGGALSIIKELHVKEIMLPKTTELSELEKELLTSAKRKRIPSDFVCAGDNWKAGGIIFHVVSPQAGVKMERNNGSIVLYAKIGGLSWLFTGDLEKEGEDQLINHFDKLKIDVLKAGHHGSKSSTTKGFLDQLEPKLAVILAGKNNRYGHPDEEVLMNLNERKIKILRTDQHGAITYIFKGETGTFSAVLP
ncbi:DNA internalization-related competence protein ComEC/Rec2 [Cytobacillus massiliigabonensis]|uniref:DNA internalization-related competence protein ComEC/Rec2 n=1 Tax=Cytobacillus massiliigabonensis TaxID=1871011 RepID=UPI001F4085A4|nr:DNA internalization-related competence protein ComEC/Rec2 [Cytobacillus massiliigabonensis]